MSSSWEEARRGCAGPGGLSPAPAASCRMWRLLEKGAGGKGRLRAALSGDRRMSGGAVTAVVDAPLLWLALKWGSKDMKPALGGLGLS